MDPKRQGEIAILLVRHILREKGVRVSKEMVRELANVAKKINVPLEELKDFFKPLLEEMIEEVFPSKKS